MKQNWMWLPDWKCNHEEKATHAFFQLKFMLTDNRLSQLGEEAGRIRISADSRYKLFVNGTLVQYGPAKGDAKLWYYDEFSLLSYLKEGENTLLAEVLYYHCPGENVNFGVFHSANPGFFFDATDSKMEELQGEWSCCSDEAFHIVREAPGFAPLMVMEKRDALVLPEQMSWQKAMTYAPGFFSLEVSPGNLAARPIPFMYLERKAFLTKNEPVCVPANCHVSYVLDAGEEETAFLYLQYKGGKNAQVKITYSECYYLTDAQGNSYKKDRADAENGHIEGFFDTIVLGGEEGVYSPFWIRTFRYVMLEITTKDEPLTIDQVYFEETGYPLLVKTKINTGSEEFDRIWDISLRTLKRCMQETYTDCPYYEQLQYAMDSRTQILFTYQVSADDRLAKECMRAFLRSQRYDGLVNAAYPSTASNVIPGFTMYYLFMLYDHMMYFGDKEFLREFLGSIDRALGFFDAHLDKRGLVDKIGGLNVQWERFWSFIDWVDVWRDTTGVPSAIKQGPITMESLLYLAGLLVSAKVLEYVGRLDVAREYQERANTLKIAIRKHCVGTNGMIMDGPGVEIYSQHCQVWGILTGVFEEEEKAVEALERTLKEPQNHAQCSVAMTYYLFRALEKVDLYHYADEKWDIWRRMLAKNLTTCVEDEIRERSDCHAWGALALYELPAVVLGVRPTAPGFAQCGSIQHTEKFPQISAEVITPKGIKYFGSKA